MGFTYHHLSGPDVRIAMLACWRAENDELVASDTRSDCYGADLVDAGWREWEAVMPEALQDHDDDWLFGQMTDATFFRSSRPRHLKDGRMSSSQLKPENAARVLCFSEF